jgi:peptidoglycan/LPS O-acetylase OafA/YrhL
MQDRSINFPQNNNFGLLRFFAALQVACFHGYTHFAIEGKNVFVDFLFQKIIIYFPGVPIFFAISGFLIFSSYHRRQDLQIYCKNRFLRLYPGLWFSFLLTLVILISFQIIKFQNLLNSSTIFWIIGQVTCFQFYTPDLLRGYGLGNPNGSLWTIAVELQFYVFVPILYKCFSKVKIEKNYILVILMLLSILLNVFLSPSVESNSLLGKIAGVTLFPYLFYFLLGALTFLNYNKLFKYIEGKAVLAGIFYFFFYFVFSQICKLYYPSYWPNIFGLVNIFLLVWFLFAFTFSASGLSQKILKGNDISYGLYLYHGIILNFFIHIHAQLTMSVFVIYILLSLIFGFLSWKIVEQKAMKLTK